MFGAGICVIALRMNTPAPLGVTLWLTAAWWLGLLAALPWPLVRAFGGLESIRMPRTPDAVGAVRATVATLLIAGALWGIMLGGFSPTAAALLLGPAPAAVAAVLGLVVLSRTPGRRQLTG